MATKKSMLLFFAFVFCCWTILVQQAVAASYTYTLDRFEASGNHAGNIVDEFDDGVINHPWEIYDPTVVESGGVINFRNPGMKDQFQLNNLLVDSEMSYLHYNLSLADGNGDFSATSKWTSGVPGTDQFFVMNTSEGRGGEEFVIGFANFGSEAAGLFGIPQGPSVFFGRIGDINSIRSGDYEVFGTPVSMEQVTGSIYLRLLFNDDTDLFSGAYSLDGQNFITPSNFGSISVGSVGLDVEGLTMGGESWEVQVVPVPSSISLFLCGLMGLISIGRYTIKA